MRTIRKAARPGGVAKDLAQSAEPPRKSAATRARILDAAAKVFSLNGYAGARLADIASEADTQAGSLYYHFASREALVEEVLDIAIDRVTAYVAQRVASLPQTATARERIATAVEAHLVMALQHDYYASASLRILMQLPEPIRRRHLLRQRRYGRFWRGLLELARDAGEIRADLDLSVVRMLLLGSINWSAEWYRPGRLTVSDVAAQLITMFFDGTADQLEQVSTRRRLA